MNKEAERIISILKLQPHPEGGYFREVYRSDEQIEQQDLPPRYDGRRCFSTSIYFLLCDDQCSNLHRIKSDETWHHYDGSDVKIFIINPSGDLKIAILGKNLSKDEQPQITIRKGSWFGAHLNGENSFALIGCTVAPGFEYGDFELGSRKTLLETYPQHSEVINKLTGKQHEE